MTNGLDFPTLTASALLVAAQSAAVVFALIACKPKKPPVNAATSQASLASSKVSQSEATSSKKPNSAADKSDAGNSKKNGTDMLNVKEDPDLKSKGDYNLNDSKIGGVGGKGKDAKKDADAKDKKSKDDKPKEKEKEAEKNKKDAKSKDAVKSKEPAAKSKEAAGKGKKAGSGEKAQDKTQEEDGIPKVSIFAQPDILQGPNIFAVHNPNKKEEGEKSAFLAATPAEAGASAAPAPAKKADNVSVFVAPK